MTFDLSQEVVTRAAIIRGCARALKPVLSNPRLALSKKLSLVKAHIFASGLFQCSTWGPLSTPLYSKTHAAVVQVYRIATKHVFNPASVNFIFSDADLISEYGLVSPMVMIRQSRLSLSARLAAKSPRCVLDLLKVFWDRDCG